MSRNGQPFDENRSWSPKLKPGISLAVALRGSSLLLHIDELSIAEAVDGADWLAATARGGSARGR